MKTKITLLLLMVSMVCMAETHQKIKYLTGTREYVVHVPKNYNPKRACGMLVYLHGLGGKVDRHATMAQDFADKYGWIVVMPQASSFLNIDPSVFPAGSLPEGFEQALGLPAWNSGIKAKTLQKEINGALDDLVSQKIVALLAKMYLGIEFARWENTRDADFVEDVIKVVKKKYAVANDSVFVSGMSMGGFMTHRMLIEKSQYFKAGVAVSGLIGDGIMNKQPRWGYHPRVMQIHGTVDDIVGYDGYAGFYGYMAKVGLDAEATVEYWRKYNRCYDLSEMYSYPDANPYDGMTFDRYTYNSRDAKNSVAFIKVNNGLHEWYGAFEGKDIDYMEEIYLFCTNKSWKKGRGMAAGVESESASESESESESPRKVLVDGELKIIQGGREYNVLGQ